MKTGFILDSTNTEYTIKLDGANFDSLGVEFGFQGVFDGAIISVYRKYRYKLDPIYTEGSLLESDWLPITGGIGLTDPITFTSPSAGNLFNFLAPEGSIKFILENPTGATNITGFHNVAIAAR